MRFRLPLIRDLLEYLLFHNDPELPKGKSKINPTRNWKKYKSIHLQECASYLVIDDPWFPHRHVDYSSRFRRKSFYSLLRKSQLWKVSEYTSGPWSPIAPAGPSSPRAPCNQRLSFKIYIGYCRWGETSSTFWITNLMFALRWSFSHLHTWAARQSTCSNGASRSLRKMAKQNIKKNIKQLRLIYPPQHKTQKCCFKKETWSWYGFEHRFVYETSVRNKRNRPNTQRTHFYPIKSRVSRASFSSCWTLK